MAYALIPAIHNVVDNVDIDNVGNGIASLTDKTPCLRTAILTGIEDPQA